ncbi:hypothetical protein LINPERHAP2_LOCUS33977 [Linum perenne]
MLFYCNSSRELWNFATENLPLPNPNDSIQLWFLNLHSASQHLPLHVAACAWTIWICRNEKVFSNINPTIEGLKRKFSNSLSDFNSLRDTRNPPRASQHVQLSDYQPPSSEQRLLLCDGSFQGATQKAGFCAVLFDADGRVIDGRADSFLSRTSTCAEATALSNAVRLAMLYPYPTVILSDCRIVVDALKDPLQQWPWECEATLACISDDLHTAPWIEIKHCRRQIVHSVDRVAKLSRDNLLPPNWLESLF